MLDTYLELISEKIKEGHSVYLAPAAMETVVIAKMLKDQYGIYPTGFCDNDPKKQGRQLNSIPELSIISFDQVLSDKHAFFLIYSPHHSAEIMGNLVFEKGMASERIINYHSIEKKKCCGLMAHNWIIQDNGFVCCCMGKESPSFDHRDYDVAVGIENLDFIRNKMIDGVAKMPEKCETCYRNRESYIYASRKLNSFDFSFRGWCNYKCEYCSANKPDLKGYNDRFSLEPYLEELEKRDMVNDIFSVLYAVGESCLNEKRFPLYDYCVRKRYFLDVFSNCSVFDEALFKAAHKSPVIIRKSFDAGTPETYYKIKGVKMGDKMLDNVRRYLEAPYFGFNPKYLFVPGVNDNEKDVERFVEICKEFRVDFVTPVFSFLADDFYGSEHAKEMFAYLVDLLSKNNIFTASVDTLYSEKYHKEYKKALK